MEIQNLEPKILWRNFAKITKIPRPSKHEEKIIAFVENFAKNLKLDYQKDKTGNIIIRKKPHPKMKNRKTITLQAHLDMVPQKNSNTKHNFKKDAIKTYIKDGWIRAKGTTLGADNGIGVASCLAILEAKNIKHGPLEVLLTVDEETGLVGATNLKKNILQGDILLNLDSEDEGELYIGCAGGIETKIELKLEKEKNKNKKKGLEIEVKGLEGGHSGCDIHLGRGNANKILNRILWSLNQKHKFALSSFNGGDLHNVIPREAKAKISFSAKTEETIIKEIKKISKIIKKEYKASDANLKITTKKDYASDFVWPRKTQDNFLNTIFICPDGIIRLIPEQLDTVETSTNLAVIKTKENKIIIETSQRSSIDSARDNIMFMIGNIFKLVGAKIRYSNPYPGWKPNINSQILKIMKKIYKDNFKTEAKIKVIHAGLECGIIKAKYPKIDMISFGPTIRYPHSPDEKLEIKSVEKFWKFLLLILEKIPKK